MEPLQKRMKITSTVWDFVLQFITNHPEMATGKFEGPNGKQHIQKLWNELSEKLNALGYGAKTANKWQKSFADWKYNVKQKYAEIKTHRTRTGGGPFIEKKLTPQEETLMGLIGISSMEGDGVVEEIGLGIKEPTPVAELIQAGTSTSEQEEEVIQIVISEGLSRPSSEASDVDASRPPTPQPCTSQFRPHQPTRTRGSVLEQFQAETMNELRAINNNLGNISSDIKRLTDSIIAFLNK